MIEVVAVCIAAVSVVIAAWYSWLTYRILQVNEKAVATMTRQAEIMQTQVSEMQSQNESSARPYIGIAPFVFRGGHMIYLRIENSGRASASDLALEVDRDFFAWSKPEKNLRNFRAFSKPIQSFPPGSTLVFALGTYGQIFCDGPGHDHGMSLEFAITAKYSFGDKTYTETTGIDLNQFYNTEAEPDPIVEQLSAVAKALTTLTSK